MYCLSELVRKVRPKVSRQKNLRFTQNLNISIRRWFLELKHNCLLNFKFVYFLV